MQRNIILPLLALITAVGSGMTAHANTIDVPREVVEISEELGAQYDICPELIGRYEDVGVVLMMYNGDSSAVDVFAGSEDVSAYADEILALSEELERENGK